MLPLSFRLYTKNGERVQIAQTHWWLTSFLVGCYSNPEDLLMENSLCFPNTEMLNSFVKGLIQAGISPRDILVCGLRVSFYYCNSNAETPNYLTRFWCDFSQWKNRLFCKLYISITKPFCTTEDRVLYLYYYLPFAFRKLLRIHRFDKRCHRKHKCMKKNSPIKKDSHKNTSEQQR